MSHREEGFVGGAAFASGLTWDNRATGIDAAIATTRTRLTHFETRANMRFSSAIKLNEQMAMAVSERELWLGPTRFRVTYGPQDVHTALSNVP